MKVRLLGPVAVTDRAGQPVPLGRRRAALVAALTLARPHPISTDHLGDVVWPADLPPTWRNTLQVHISWLRRTASLDIRPGSGGYHLNLEPADVDVDQFHARLSHADELFTDCRFDDASVSAGQPAALPEASAAYRGALQLWRGDPLPEFEYEEWAQADRASLREEHLSGLSRWYRCELALGHEHEITGGLRELVSRLPLREDLWWLLVHALHRQQRTAEALEAWAQARRTLRDELGVDPGPRLRALHQLLLHPAEGERVTGSPAAAVPSAFTTFVGRERELAAVTTLLTGTGPRLVSLVGPGGVGKTRLAAECAARLGPLPVVWVSLDGLADDDDVAPALARAVGVTAIRGDLTAELIAAASRPAVWVLDNCEHVLDGARRVASAVLSPVSRVVLLTTSRESLRLRSETVVALAPLPVTAHAVSDGLSPAARLLQDRVVARGHQPLPDAALQRVAEAMDGLPLALELAATSVGTIGVDGLLGDPLGGLLGGPLGGLPGDPTSGPPSRPGAVAAWTDGPERHQGLRQSLTWSWRLLTAQEQSFLATLGTFPASFDAQAAAAVSGRSVPDSATLLAALAERSMLVTERGSSGTAAQARFRLLRIVRSFALTHLNDADATRCRRRLMRHYLSGPAGGPVAGGITVDLPLGRVETLLADRDNLHAAFTAALTVHPSDAARLACRLTMPWVLTGLWGEIEEMLEHAVRALSADKAGSQQTGALPGDDTSAELLFCQSFVAGNLGDHERAVASAGVAADLASRCGRDDLELLALAMMIGSTRRGDAIDKTSVARARHLLERESSPGVRSVTFLNLGIRAMLDDDPRGSVKHWLSALDEARRAGLRDLQAAAMGNLSEAALGGERDQEAAAWAEGALRICAQVPRSTTLNRIRANIGQARLGLGDVETADAILREVCAQAHASGDRRLALEAVLVLAAAAAASGNRERATVLSCGYAAHLRAQGWRAQPSGHVLIRRYHLPAAPATDFDGGVGGHPRDDHADAAVVRGASLSLDDLMTFATAPTAGADPSPAPAVDRTPPRDAHV